MKFPELHLSQYMNLVQLVEGKPIQLVPMDWAHGLENSRIMSLMHMPHFGHIAKFNACVK